MATAVELFDLFSSQDVQGPTDLIDDVNDLDRQLLVAAKSNDLALVQELLDKGANADYEYQNSNAWNDVRDCPLHRAVTLQNLEMTRLLLSRGYISCCSMHTHTHTAGAKTIRKSGSEGWSRGSHIMVIEAICNAKGAKHMSHSMFAHSFNCMCV